MNVLINVLVNASSVVCLHKIYLRINFISRGVNASIHETKYDYKFHMFDVPLLFSVSRRAIYVQYIGYNTYVTMHMLQYILFSKKQFWNSLNLKQIN